MKYLSLACLTALVLIRFTPVFADEGPEWEKPKEGIRSTCFNVHCKYEQCNVVAVFDKIVTQSGKEILDRSEGRDNPKFQVQCDQQSLFNGAAHRYTDYGGTRIQAVGGPYPAILLPKNALSDINSYYPSSLELDGQILSGHCYVYTGPSL